VVVALLAKGADVKAQSNVSIARACALCPHLAHSSTCRRPMAIFRGVYLYVCLSCCVSRRRFCSKA
jgi:hypothetical protein